MGAEVFWAVECGARWPSVLLFCGRDVCLCKEQKQKQFILCEHEEIMTLFSWLC